MLEEMLKVEDVQRLLAIPRSKVYRMTSRKELPFYKIGRACRFKQSELDKFLSSKKVTPEA